VQYNVFDPEKTTTELYNLSTDLGEANNIAEKYPDLVKELMEIMNAARTESEIFTFGSETYLE
jgi:arylsulfatase A